jgi:hypothetical protein
VEECAVVTASEATKYECLGISLDTTSCPNGGQRSWFRCPDCSRRVLKLYCPPCCPSFACSG